MHKSPEIKIVKISEGIGKMFYFVRVSYLKVLDFSLAANGEKLMNFYRQKFRKVAV